MIRSSIFRDVFGNNPTMKVLDFLIENKGIDFSKKEIIEGAGISKDTLFNYWQEIEEQQIVIVTRKFGKTKLYTLNSKNLIVKKLLELEGLLIEGALNQKKTISVHA